MIHLKPAIGRSDMTRERSRRKLEKAILPSPWETRYAKTHIFPRVATRFQFLLGVAG